MSDADTYFMELVVPTTAAKVITVIQVIYGLPSLLIMILFFFFLGYSNNYKHSFYRVVQLDLLTNILCYVNNWFGMRIGKHPAGIRILKLAETLIPGMYNFSEILVNFFMHMQFCSSAALNLHRITSVIFHQSYEKFWSRYYPLVGLIFAANSVIPIICVGGQAADVYVQNGSLMVTYHWKFLDAVLFQNAILSTTYFLLLLVIGLFTAVLVSRKIRAFNDNDKGISKKLTKIALTYSTVYTGILLNSVLSSLDTYLHFLPEFYHQIDIELLTFSSDMMTLALPYILLLYDSNVRRDVIQLFRRQRAIGTTQGFISSSSNN